MKKRNFALLLLACVLILTFAVLTSCGGDDTTGTTATTATRISRISIPRITTHSISISSCVFEEKPHTILYEKRPPFCDGERILF